MKQALRSAGLTAQQVLSLLDLLVQKYKYWLLYYCKSTQLTPEATAHQINHINCHATSTPQGDAVESKAVALAFPHCPHLHLSSSKGNIGHLLGAAGAVFFPSLFAFFFPCLACSYLLSAAGAVQAALALLLKAPYTSCLRPYTLVA